MKDAILWKRILNEGIEADGEAEALEKLQNSICCSTIIVCPLVDVTTAKARRYLDYSKLSVPFERFWIERSLTDAGPIPLQQGMMIATAREDKYSTLTVTEILAATGHRPRLVASWQFRIDHDGRVVLRNASEQIEVNLVFQHGAMSDERIKEEVRTATFDLLDMLAMLSCKNVSLEPRDNDPKQVKRAIKRHGGTPDSYRYHVLVVRPPGAKSNTPSQEIGIMPRHVCRGHFAEYGPEFNKGLLFGKYSGRFYVPPCLKGDKKNGEVAKDYAVTNALAQ